MTIYNDKASKFYRMDTMIIPYIVPVDRHDKMAVFEERNLIKIVLQFC